MNRNEGVDYMCNSNNDNGCCDPCANNCIAEILQVICVLQANASPSTCLNSCDRPALGGGSRCIICNTRPIQLYTGCGNGVPWSMPISRETGNCSESPGDVSCVFRIEKIDGCCATFRVLAPNEEPSAISPYVATDSIFTMDINCLCCCRCLNDTYVEIC